MPGNREQSSERDAIALEGIDEISVFFKSRDLRSALTDASLDIGLEQIIKALRKQGISRSPSAIAIWERLLEQLNRNFHIAKDIEKLERSGLRKETLLGCLFPMRFAVGIDHFLKQAFGDKKQRRRYRKLLLAPIPVLSQVAELIGPTDEKDTLGIPSPKGLIKGLEQYASMMSWGETVYESIGTNSLSDVARYALAGVTKRVTGKFLDREVSALTGAALGDYDYDETRHRVWRIRTFQKFERQLGIVPTLLQAFNQVLSESEADNNSRTNS